VNNSGICAAYRVAVQLPEFSESLTGNTLFPVQIGEISLFSSRFGAAVRAESDEQSGFRLV
jgi:hypothetical protein